MNNRHKHADVIHAWAEGAEIQYEHKGNWIGINTPDWYDDIQYRIKPKTVKKEGWVNVYGPSSACICPTKEAADKHAAPHRKACIRIEWEETE